ncbi:hypothetical protein GGR03_002906 [Aurantimonas endophytica]|uniref:Uncharacterized protein n=1 Tax=Aurantimonas endophytica TaxID=1522175 RepID=A0A7W6MQ92_9HYPH|nr:hypothetical protein [Aurantimonas endophytica]
MVFGLLDTAGIASDLGIEDEKAGLQFGDMGSDTLAMFFEHLPARRSGHVAFRTERRVAQHLADRHAGRFQAAEKFDPRQDGCVVVPLSRAVTISIGKQPDPLIIAKRVGRQTRPPCELADLHGSLSRHDADTATPSSAL